MRILAENQGRTYGAMSIDAPGDVVNPFPGNLFPCMIWDHDGSFSEAQRSEVTRRLLEAGCRYVVCGGQNCEAWHNATDKEFLRQHADDSYDTRDDLHVMTTWHVDESPDDVAFFFVLNMNFDDHDFEYYLVLHIGDGRAMDEVDAAVRRYALNKDAV